jgi:cytochrome c oxidase assembly protein subunit 15
MRARMGAAILAVLVTAQAVLGIATLLLAAPLALALAHQAFAVVVFTASIVHAEWLWHGAPLGAPKTAAAEQPA